ncbi:MAG TPA: metalloregulator ArsR/SmtB family transcription factor [Methanocorpusculum sp.]|nr:metalloregulator ArsR/SmtB family transcription factor [Methanocorpusculum sp.]
MDAEVVFKALGDATRLRIFALLKEEELCVCEIEEGLSLSQPNASRHLAVMKNAGIIQVRRSAQKTYCKISTEFVKEYPFLLRELNMIADALPTSNADRIALQQFRSQKRVHYGF